MQRATLLKSRGVDYREPRPPRRRPCTIEAQMIEDFEHPICVFCTGVGWVRDENGIEMVHCSYCEGAGRAPAPERESRGRSASTS